MAARLPRLPGAEVLKELEKETMRQRFTERTVSGLEVLAESVDDIIQALVGDRPVEDLLRLLAHISPAATWRRITGAPAPGEILRGIRARIREEIERMEKRMFPGAERAKQIEKEILG